MSRKIKDAFEPIKADRQMKERTKEYLLAESERRRKKSFWQRPVFYRTAAGVLLLVLIFAVSMKKYEVQAEAAYITMEGPVQIGLSVNEENAVVSVEGLNSDGETVVSQVDVTGMHYEEALQKIMDTETYQQCQGERAKIKVSSHDEEQETVMQQTVTKTCHAYGQQYREHHREENEESEHSTDQENHGEKHDRETGHKKKSHHEE